MLQEPKEVDPSVAPANMNSSTGRDEEGKKNQNTHYNKREKMNSLTKKTLKDSCKMKKKLHQRGI